LVARDAISAPRPLYCGLLRLFGSWLGRIGQDLAVLRVAFLRGVNVGRVRVPMADLRDLFAELGFAGSRTVLNTGNVLFESGASESELAGLLEPALSERFAYAARVFVLDHDAVRSAAEACPFDESPEHHRYAVLCADERVARDLAGVPVELGPDEDRALGGRIVYWRVPRGQTLDSPFGKVLAGREFSPATTNRNLKTLIRIADHSTS